MKKVCSTVLALTFIAGTALWANEEPQRPENPDRREPGRMDGHRPPPPPVMVVLDVNRDGALDAQEIANASAALLQLDKNGDGQLSNNELRPPRPERPNDNDPKDGPRRTPPNQP